MKGWQDSSPVAIVHERNIAPATDDDVIQDPDADKVADFTEAAGDLQVFLAGRGIAAGVIVLCGEVIYVQRPPVRRRNLWLQRVVLPVGASHKTGPASDMRVGA